MEQADVVALMQSSASEDEWNENLDKVKEAFGGYPEFWYSAILAPGIHTKTAAKCGTTPGLTIEALSRRPIPNLYSRPTSMPHLREGEKVVGVYDQGLGEKECVCNSLLEMQQLYDSYARGVAIRLKWVIESSLKV